jgi:hypothetical protein
VIEGDLSSTATDGLDRLNQLALAIETIQCAAAKSDAAFRLSSNGRAVRAGSK